MVKNHSNHETAFTRIELCVVIIVATVLAGIVFVVLRDWKYRGCRLACANNVRCIYSRCYEWAIDHHDKYPMQVSVKDGGTMELIGRGDVRGHFLVLSNEFRSAFNLVCPNDKERWEKWEKLTRWERLIGVHHDPFPKGFPISYFIGVDADGRHPQMLLAGDDNFTVDGQKPKPGLLNLWTNSQVAWTGDRHGDGTWVAFPNGVEFLTTRRLQEALISTGMATNRLAMPQH